MVERLHSNRSISVDPDVPRLFLSILSYAPTIHERRERNLQERRGSCGQENEEHPITGCMRFSLHTYLLLFSRGTPYLVLVVV